MTTPRSRRQYITYYVIRCIASFKFGAPKEFDLCMEFLPTENEIKKEIGYLGGIHKETLNIYQRRREIGVTPEGNIYWI